MLLSACTVLRFPSLREGGEVAEQFTCQEKYHMFAIHIYTQVVLQKKGLSSSTHPRSVHNGYIEVERSLPPVQEVLLLLQTAGDLSHALSQSTDNIWHSLWYTNEPLIFLKE